MQTTEEPESGATVRDAPWLRLVAPGPAGGGADAATPPSSRRLFGGLFVLAALVVLVVLAVGVFMARQLAEREAVHDAARTAQLLGDVIVEPAVTDALLDGDPAAREALDELVRGRVLGSDVVRVKIWSPEGAIVYSDEPRLIGQQFGLGEEERETLENGGVEAEVSDLAAPENRFEAGQGALLEAYHAVTSPSGRTVLFEAYFRYDEVSVRAGELWAAFSALSAGSVLVLLVLLLPLGGRLLALLRAGRERREHLLQRALDASADERRRIAARMHDGAIQDLTAGALALSGAASKVRRAGDDGLALELDEAASTVRGSVGGLRTLLVDVYPPSLAASGLGAALSDLASAVRARGVAVELELDDRMPLTGDEERLVFRVVRECLANTVRHGRARSATVQVHAGPSAAAGDRPSETPPHSLALTVVITDDGRGFDPAALSSPDRGHVGTQLLIEAARDAGAGLWVASTPGQGTSWLLRLPLDPQRSTGEEQP